MPPKCDCWDENTATYTETGEPFIFNAGWFYGQNVYDLGNWPQHRLGSKVYIKTYKQHFPVSEPGKMSQTKTCGFDSSS